MAYAENKKARFDYEILDTIEAGIELFGYEVKAVRSGFARLEGSYAIVRGGEIYIVGMHISPYQSQNTPGGYDPERTRRLLLSKKEIAELEIEIKKLGLTIVPISMYNKGIKIKVSLGLAKGKKKFDKRETIKKRDIERDIGRTLKN